MGDVGVVAEAGATGEADCGLLEERTDFVDGDGAGVEQNNNEWMTIRDASDPERGRVRARAGDAAVIDMREKYACPKES